MAAQGRAKRRPGIDGPRPSRSPERARQPVAQRKGLGIVPIAGTRPFGMPLQGAGTFTDSKTQGGASRLRRFALPRAILGLPLRGAKPGRGKGARLHERRSSATSALRAIIVGIPVMASFTATNEKGRGTRIAILAKPNHRQNRSPLSTSDSAWRARTKGVFAKITLGRNADCCFRGVSPCSEPIGVHGAAMEMSKRVWK